MVNLLSAFLQANNNTNGLILHVLLQLQQLYIEVMYTIQHRLGANSAQYHHIKEELFTHAQV
jgi:hypothetical protein